MSQGTYWFERYNEPTQTKPGASHEWFGWALFLGFVANWLGLEFGALENIYLMFN